MDMSTAKLEAEWQGRMEAQAMVAEKKHADEQAALRKAHETEFSELAKVHQSEVAALKSLLQKEAHTAASDGAAAEKMRYQLEADLRTERSERSSEMAALLEKHRKELDAAEDVRRSEVEALRRNAQQSAAMREEELMTGHAKEVSDLHALKESTIKEMNERMENDRR